MKASDLMTGDWVRTNKKVEDEYYFDEYQPGEIIKVREILDNGINPDWCGGEVNNMLNLDAIEPIPLTPEILEKNGFELSPDCVYEYIYEDEDRTIICCPKGTACINSACGYISVYAGCLSVEEMPIDFVHELQHVLKLCEIKKEWKV